MKKIGFCDTFDLTKAVLDGKKTQVRKIITKPVLRKIRRYLRKNPGTSVKDAVYQICFVENNPLSCYQVGEVVAISQCYKDCGNLEHLKDTPGWTSKMNIDPSLMPHHIQILDLRIQSLRGITREDCLAEGVWFNKYSLTYHINNLAYVGLSPRKTFSRMIDYIYGRGTWENNPLVLAYTFKLLD